MQVMNKKNVWTMLCQCSLSIYSLTIFYVNWVRGKEEAEQKMFLNDSNLFA